MPKESVHIVDPLHEQFLDEVWTDERQRGLSKRQRQLFAQLISASALLQQEEATPLAALAKLKQTGLGELLDSLQDEKYNPEALAHCVTAHMASLIRYWEEPHLEKCGLPMFEQAMGLWLSEQS